MSELVSYNRAVSLLGRDLIVSECVKFDVGTADIKS